jgi:glutamate racemase
MIYLGDTARVPYGNKSRETIIRYALECASLLVNKYHVNGLIVACNTISSYAIDNIKAAFGLPVRGVVRAGAEAALEATKSGRIGVIGTLATINSGAYTQMLDTLSDGAASVIQKACPLFVPFVEEAFITGNIPRLVIKYYMDELIQQNIDTLILGCTHYPVLRPLIAELYPAVSIVDSSAALIKHVHSLGIAQPEAGKRGVLLTDPSPGFLQLKELLMGDVRTMVIDLADY